MRIPTEAIGSIPRPPEWIAAIGVRGHDHPDLEPLSEQAIRDRVLEAAEYIPLEQLGTTDGCGFSPFCGDTSTSRPAFAKIEARVRGTALAAARLVATEPH